MSESLDTRIMRAERQELATPHTTDNPFIDMIREHIGRGGTVESISALTKVCMEIELHNAKKAFARAFAELQEAIPAAMAQHKNSHLKNEYASLNDMQEAVNPVAKRFGFSVSFDSHPTEGGMRVECIVTHRDSGHSERVGFTVRSSTKVNPAVNEAQVDAGTLTTGQRMALRLMFNLKIDYDADVKLLGDYISDAQAAELRRRLAAVGRDVGKFLAVAGAKDFAQIRAGKYAMLDDLLLKAEKLNAGGAQAGRYPAGNGVTVPPPSTGANLPTETGPVGPMGSSPVAGEPSPRVSPATARGCQGCGEPVLPSGHCSVCGALQSSLPSGAVPEPSPLPEGEPPQNAAQDWASQAIGFLTGWLLSLPPKERQAAMLAAAVPTLVDAPEDSVRNVSFHAKIAQLTKGIK